MTLEPEVNPGRPAVTRPGTGRLEPSRDGDREPDGDRVTLTRVGGLSPCVGGGLTDSFTLKV